MFFRFGSALVLIVCISLTGVALEKRNLELRREVSRQYYRTEVLLERYARLRAETQQLGAPTRTFESLKKRNAVLAEPAPPKKERTPDKPLMHWQYAPELTIPTH